jgi:pimeloyl-ACP methyl ester carboxylesterase
MGAAAQAQINFGPCGEGNEFACGHLTVPLDPSGTTPGTITLAIRRHRAPLGDGRVAVVALAGGPGQAALPFTEQFQSLLGPILQTRDEIVFDQRGTGLSDRLRCPAVERPAPKTSVTAAVAACATELGPQRSFYTSADTVADIEAIRVAGGYEKLVLFGTSYGTKVAEEYAAAHPSRVEALVLDSVVPPDGPDPFDRSTFAAVPRILHQLCAGSACAAVSPHPVQDLARLVTRLSHRPLVGRWIGEHGRPHRLRVDSEALLETLVAGDLEPTLRAELPAAVRAGLEGDGAPLARLIERAEEAEADEATGVESFDVPLYYATTCEETDFPWNRSTTPAERLAAARAGLGALGPGALFPFTPADALGLSDIPACAAWPFAPAAPAPVSGSLPDVPTLILSGADDLRTPTSGAREVAAEIPGSHVLVVPNVGHSVLGSDPSGCAAAALQALFANTPIKACANTPPEPLLRPTPAFPARLERIAPAPHNGGRPGRALEAVALTLADLKRQLSYLLLAELGSDSLSQPTSLSLGGLRAGWAGLSDDRLRLDGYAYVPGVRITGSIDAGQGSLQISGTAGAEGTVTVRDSDRLGGVLGGVPLRTITAAGV